MTKKKTGETNKKVYGYIREVNGIWHIVIAYYDEKGNRKLSSVSTKLKIRGNKKNAIRMMEQVIGLFEPPKKREKVNLKKYLDGNLEETKETLEKKSKIQNKKSVIDAKGTLKITQDMLFADFLYFWLEAARNSIEENTYASYHMTSNSKIAPYFKEREIKLNELTSIDIQQYYNYSTNVENISANTVLKRYNNINQSLKYAIKLELIDKNPADAVIKPKKVKFNGTAAYNQDELNQLFNVFKNDSLELAVYLACFYGLRREEIVGIKWKNIDFENHTLTIRSVVTCTTLEGKLVEIEKDRTKNKSSERTFPLMPIFEELLLKIKSQQDINKKDYGMSYNPTFIDYVYVDKLGNRMKPGYITQHFSDMLKKNNMRHIRFHDLRHTCATIMLSKGENLAKVQKWLGHSTISTTANIYSHLDFKSKVESANNLLEIMPNSLI